MSFICKDCYKKATKRELNKTGKLSICNSCDELEEGDWFSIPFSKWVKEFIESLN